jgi:branched-chain amino acid transport system permease protein
MGLSVIYQGLAVGSIYALVAMSYNVIFATTGVLNFAQGQLVMVGSMVGVLLFASLGWNPLIALLVTVAVGAVIGALEERIAVRPAKARVGHALGWILATLGVAIVLEAVVGLVLGSDIRTMPDFVWAKPVFVLGVAVLPHRVLLFVIAVGLAVILSGFYRKTLLGRALRATEENRRAASLRGIPVDRVSMLSFAIGGGMAALTGFLAAPITGAYATVGVLFALKGFIAAVIGGIPDIRGALVGGLILGLVEQTAAYYIGPGYRLAAVFAVLLIMLAVMPGGIFSSRSVRAV